MIELYWNNEVGCWTVTYRFPVPELMMATSLIVVLTPDYGTAYFLKKYEKELDPGFVLEYKSTYDMRYNRGAHRHFRG